jgi:tRNA pseudouridine38-40 synthase
MGRVALEVEYDGTAFFGWQTQTGRRTVQSELEAALCRVADEPVGAHAAGRTDTGVHAAGQVVHFDARATRSQRQWVLGLNSALPDDLAVRGAVPVPSHFDARRSALARCYHYLIHQGIARSPLLQRRSWWISDALEVEPMRAAAGALIGEHDFSAFRAAGCQSQSPFRAMHRIDFRTEGPLLCIEFEANAFLYHMVRNLVGTLVEIGRGRRPPEWVSELLETRDRTLAAMTAPAAGLTLAAVTYPPEFPLPVAPARDWLAFV